MNEDRWIRRHFPNLRRGRYKITSPYDEAYNCIAWAAGDTERWWWPVNSVYSFWLPNLPYEETIESFVRAFQTLGYQPCKAGELEPAFEKLAIYTKSDGTPTHMARQLQSGLWTSKLGESCDIEHQRLEDIEGDIYGKASHFLKRPLAHEEVEENL